MTSPTFETPKKPLGISPPSFTGVCPLVGYGIKCGLGWHLHHWVGRGVVLGNKKARRYLDQHVNMTWVCGAHNIERWADARRGRQLITWHKVMVEGHHPDELEAFIDGIPWKVQPHEYKWEVLISGVEFGTV